MRSAPATLYDLSSVLLNVNAKATQHKGLQKRQRRRVRKPLRRWIGPLRGR
ncbi:hypothetical protein CLBKND_04880 [Methylorubrum aminovorans]